MGLKVIKTPAISWHTDSIQITFSENANVRTQGLTLMRASVPVSFIPDVSAGEIRGTWQTEAFNYSSEQKGTIHMR